MYISCLAIAWQAKRQRPPLCRYLEWSINRSEIAISGRRYPHNILSPLDGKSQSPVWAERRSCTTDLAKVKTEVYKTIITKGKAFFQTAAALVRT